MGPPSSTPTNFGPSLAESMSSPRRSRRSPALRRQRWTVVSVARSRCRHDRLATRSAANASCAPTPGTPLTDLPMRSFGVEQSSRSQYATSPTTWNCSEWFTASWRLGRDARSSAVAGRPSSALLAGISHAGPGMWSACLVADGHRVVRERGSSQRFDPDGNQYQNDQDCQPVSACGER